VVVVKFKVLMRRKTFCMGARITYEMTNRYADTYGQRNIH